MIGRYIGLMSGTSMDGVDAVLVECAPCRLLGHHHQPFAATLRQRLLGLQAAGHDELHRAALLSQELAQHYARAVEHLLQHTGTPPEAVTAIGCHGQTVRHQPDSGYSLQLLDAALLAELTRIDVCCQFRQGDLAAGGQGAPLVPAFHAAQFSVATPCVIANLGGIANITILAADHVSGFDSGPGNMLLDAWIHRHQGAAFDQSGNWAASGQVDQALLQRLLAEPYLQRPPPKSTGRDLWNLDWLHTHLRGHEAAADVQATLQALTVHSLADAIDQYAPDDAAVYLCGGGARNGALRAALQRRLASRRISDTTALGIPVDQVEAAAFAWLAHQCVQRLPGNLPAVTGARHPAILGARYAHP